MLPSKFGRRGGLGRSQDGGGVWPRSEEHGRRERTSDRSRNLRYGRNRLTLRFERTKDKRRRNETEGRKVGVEEKEIGRAHV